MNLMVIANVTFVIHESHWCREPEPETVQGVLRLSELVYYRGALVPVVQAGLLWSHVSSSQEKLHEA